MSHWPHAHWPYSQKRKYQCGETSLALPPTRKEKSWTAKEQLEVIHAAGVGKSRLLLGKSHLKHQLRTLCTGGNWWTHYAPTGAITKEQ